MGHKLWSQNVTARGIELAGEGGTTGILAAKTPDASATLSPFGITHLNAFSWSDLPMFSMVYLSQNRSLIFVDICYCKMWPWSLPWHAPRQTCCFNSAVIGERREVGSASIAPAVRCAFQHNPRFEQKMLTVEVQRVLRSAKPKETETEAEEEIGISTQLAFWA